MTKHHFIAGITSALLVTGSLLSGCSTQPSEPLETTVEETVVMQEGVPGGMQTRILRLSATVESINYDTRQVTLVDKNGSSQTLTIGPEAVNFKQVEVGDQVNISYLEELVVYLKEMGTASEDGVALVAGRADEGQKPAGLVAEMVEVTAVVDAVDLQNHSATLRFPGGESRIVPVRPDVELREDQVGREVVIQKSSAVAIAVEKLTEKTQ